MLGDLPHQLLTGAGEIAQFLDRRRGHEAAANQAMCEQVRDPRRISHIGLTPRHITDVLSVGEDQFEAAFEQVPHRLPIDPGRLHGNMRTAMRTEPVGQREQPVRRGRKALNFVMDRRRNTAHRCDHGILVDVESCTPRMKHFHRASSRRREESSSSDSSSRAPRPCGRWTQFGVLAGLRVQLENGLVAPRASRPRSRRRVAVYAPAAGASTAPRFMPRGRSTAMEN